MEARYGNFKLKICSISGTIERRMHNTVTGIRDGYTSRVCVITVVGHGGDTWTARDSVAKAICADSAAHKDHVGHNGSTIRVKGHSEFPIKSVAWPTFPNFLQV